MKIKRKFLLLPIFLLIAFLIIVKLTGICQIYNLPTSSMEPTIRMKQMIIATNLKSSRRNDIVLFNRTVNEAFENDPNGETYVFCSRLIAKGGDSITIKYGYAYVNGRLVDDTTQLNFSYGLSGKDFNTLITALEIDIEKDNSGNFNRMGDTAYANLSGKQYNMIKNVIRLKRQTNFMTPPPGTYSGTEWTIDNFGPFLVPPDHFFVMGDNRDLSYDSRFHGPIPVKDCKGVMFAKF